MIFKRFRYLAILYLVAIVLLTGLGVYILFNTYFWLTSTWIFITDALVITIFLNFIRKEHRKLSNFLVSIDQGDFVHPYTKEYQDLDFNKAFEKLSKVIISLRDKAQVNYQYLQTIVNQINTAVVCLNESNKIILSNDSSKKLFNKNVLRDIHSLKLSNDNLPQVLLNLEPDEKKLMKFNLNGELFNYSVQIAKFKMQKEHFRLFSFQNVQSELEHNELESWQKLTRVMSHEIMNSVIPISNLSSLVLGKLFDSNNNFADKLNDEQKQDMFVSLQTIESRSTGLVNFVEATRNFTKMPRLELESVNVNDIINRVETLLKSKINDCEIDLEILIESEGLEIIADKSLLEQVIINLMLNAIEALQKTRNPKIIIEAKKSNDNRIVISFIDNGNGIPKGDIDNIFIPFFTTKHKGSGIGLSITKQIMYQHKGNISVKSEYGSGAILTLTF